MFKIYVCIALISDYTRQTLTKLFCGCRRCLTAGCNLSLLVAVAVAVTRWRIPAHVHGQQTPWKPVSLELLTREPSRQNQRSSIVQLRLKSYYRWIAAVDADSALPHQQLWCYRILKQRCTGAGRLAGRVENSGNFYFVRWKIYPLMMLPTSRVCYVYIWLYRAYVFEYKSDNIVC